MEVDPLSTYEKKINAKKSKADFTLRKIYFSDISNGRGFLLQGILENDPKVTLQFKTRGNAIRHCNIYGRLK